MVKKNYKNKEPDVCHENISYIEEGEKLKGENESDKKSEDKINVIIDILVEGYRNGEIGLEKMCLTFRNVLNFLPCSTTPELWKKIHMGKLVNHALECEPKKHVPGKLTKISAVRKLCCQLVIRAREIDGHIINRDPSTDKISAYEKVSQIMNNCGLVEITPTIVQKWYEHYDAKYSTQKSN